MAICKVWGLHMIFGDVYLNGYRQSDRKGGDSSSTAEPPFHPMSVPELLDFQWNEGADSSSLAVQVGHVAKFKGSLFRSSLSSAW